MKFIGDIRSIEELADGATAGPEPDMGYEVRTMAGHFEAGTVECLVRRVEMIFARTTAGDEFAVMGSDAHVLVPLGF